MKAKKIYAVEVQQVVSAKYQVKAESETDAKQMLLQNLSDYQHFVVGVNWGDPEVIGSYLLQEAFVQ